MSEQSVLDSDLNEINVFYQVLREGSFTKAARALHLPKSTVSERVGRLEGRLGVRLIERTTRSLRPTEAGAIYYERAARIVAEALAADAAVTELAQSLRGLIRMACPLVVARQFMSEVVCEFLREHPHVELELVTSERGVDLIAEGFDLGIQLLGPIAPSYIERRLGVADRLYVASPSYITQHGRPRTPKELEKHVFITTLADRRVEYRFEQGNTFVVHQAVARYSVTSIELAVDAVVHGVGIMAAPAILVGDLVRRGQLVRILESYTAGNIPISLLYPSSRHLSRRLRLLIELIVARFAALPPSFLRGEPPER